MLTKKQREIVFYNHPRNRDLVTTFILGSSKGVGKTQAATLRAIRKCCEFVPNDNIEDPTFLVVGPNSMHIRQNLYRSMFLRFLPPEIIAKKRTTPNHEIKLVNGLNILFLSGMGEIDGISVTSALIDECADTNVYTNDKYSDITTRVREMAAGQQLEIIQSGMAVSDPSFKDRVMPEDKVFIIGFDHCPYLTKDQKEHYYSKYPATFREAIDKGDWQPQAQGGAFKDVFDPTLGESITDIPIDLTRPTFVTFDPGNQAAALIIQQYGDQFVVVDEFIYDLSSTKSILKHIKDTPYGQRIREIHVDTSARLDTLEQCSEVFPHIVPYQLPKGKGVWFRTSKYETLCRALKDANGKRTVLFHKNLLNGEDRGIINSLKVIKASPSGNDFSKSSNKHDHIVEALSYFTISKLRNTQPRRMPQVVDLDY